MFSPIVKKVLDRIGQPELVQQLVQLSGTELNSLLLEVLRQQTLKSSAPELLSRYQLNRFVKPAEVNALTLKQIELDLLKIFRESLFEVLELSPVTILGACSVVALADQNKILSGLRGTEVLADATNAIALHVSDLKKRKVWIPKTRSEQIRFSTIQRHVRTQTITGKGFTPHFKIGCLVSAGMDTGSFTFEKTSLSEHVGTMKKIFEDYYHVGQISFRLICRNGYADPTRLATEVKTFIQLQHPETVVEIIERPQLEIEYYKGLQYKVDINLKGNTYEIADGGFVDWTQQLLQNNKERFLISGFGLELMYKIMYA